MHIKPVKRSHPENKVLENSFFFETLIIAILFEPLQILIPLINQKTFRKYWDSFLAITRVPMKESWKNRVNIASALKESINSLLRLKC